MTEDIGGLLRAEWEKHQDWTTLGKFVSGRLAQSYQSGFREGGKACGVKALERLLEAVKS